MKYGILKFSPTRARIQLQNAVDICILNWLQI